MNRPSRAYRGNRAPFENLGYGDDCEDYALAKCKALIADNLSPRALRIAVALFKQGEAHAVLTVATDHRDMCWII